MTLRAALILSLCCLAVACTGVRRFPAVPEADHLQAKLPGFPALIRIWGDEPAPQDAVNRERFIRQTRERVAAGGVPAFHPLVLSGGGSDGAFGAGLLAGWTARGDRPEFTFVTGISAGALIAPFAFLGPDYDRELADFLLKASTDTLLEFTILRGLFRGFGLTDTAELRAAIARHITPGVVLRLAREHARGRRLWIGTTNLDAQRPVIWDIGAIATKGGPDARRLIVDVMLASAAIPGAFPPVQIEVEIEGRRHTELHVDGGVTQQLFFFPATVDSLALPQDVMQMVRAGTMTIVRNSKIAPDYEPVKPGVVQIAGRAISTLIKFGGRNDIVVLEDRARRAGMGLQVAAVPPTFEMAEEELFDPKYMAALYATGRRLMEEGRPWVEEIPPDAPIQGASPRTARRGG